MNKLILLMMACTLGMQAQSQHIVILSDADAKTGQDLWIDKNEASFKYNAWKDHMIRKYVEKDSQYHILPSNSITACPATDDDIDFSLDFKAGLVTKSGACGSSLVNGCATLNSTGGFTVEPCPIPVTSTGTIPATSSNGNLQWKASQ